MIAATKHTAPMYAAAGVIALIVVCGTAFVIAVRGDLVPQGLWVTLACGIVIIVAFVALIAGRLKVRASASEERSGEILRVARVESRVLLVATVVMLGSAFVNWLPNVRIGIPHGSDVLMLVLICLAAAAMFLTESWSIQRLG